MESHKDNTKIKTILKIKGSPTKTRKVIRKNKNVVDNRETHTKLK